MGYKVTPPVVFECHTTGEEFESESFYVHSGDWEPFLVSDGCPFDDCDSDGHMKDQFAFEDEDR